MSDLFESPGSRNEAILQNMLGANNPLEPPSSRIEDLLQQLLEEGSGSGLPDVTAADNGKVLGVENGAWAKTPGVYFVQGRITSETGGTWSSDYTFEELTQAFQSGKTVQVGIVGVGFCNAQWINSSGHIAAVTYMAGTGGVVAFIESAGTWYTETL